MITTPFPDNDDPETIDSRMSAISDPLLGKTLAGYQFISTLGKGSFGAVYLARHPRLSLDVAVKYIQLNDDTINKYTEREIEILTQLKHSNVVRIYDAYRGERYSLIMMEWIKGGSLRRWLSKLGTARLNLQMAVEGMESVASALSEIHKRRVLHLDLKPENILLDPVEGQDYPRFVVTDFGVSKFDKTDASATGIGGTPLYMSPEHFGLGSGKPDARSDIFSFGVILYELVTGDVPFRPRSSPAEILNYLANETPPSPSKRVPGIPQELEDIILKAMQKSPDDRFQNASELQRALSMLRYNLGNEAATDDMALRTFQKIVKDHLAYADLQDQKIVASTGQAGAGTKPLFTLFVRYPDGTRNQVPFFKQSIIIGRGKESDLPLTQGAVSRQHLKITQAADGNLYVTDLDSANGTFLNGERLEANKQALLKPNEYLLVQGFTLWTGSLKEAGSEVVADTTKPDAPRFGVVTDEGKNLLDAVQQQYQRPHVSITVSPEVVIAEINKKQYVQVSVRPDDTPKATYNLRVSPGQGISEDWYTLPAGKVIEPGQAKAFDVVISLPEAGTLGGQTYELFIEVYSDNPDIPIVFQALKVKVVRFMRFSVSLQPNEVSHHRRHKANLVIMNNGNYQETFDIHIEAPDRLSVKPQMAQVAIEPATSAAVPLQFKPTRDANKDGRLLYAVDVTARSGSSQRSNGSYVFARRMGIRFSLVSVVTAVLIVGVALRLVALHGDVGGLIADINNLIGIVTHAIGGK